MLMVLRFRRYDWLVNEEARLAPAIKLDYCNQGEAAQQIRSKYITGPVFTEVYARDADQEQRDSDEH